MINVLSIHAGADTAGVGWLLSQAFRDDPDVRLRSMVRKTNYIDYPHDLDWSASDDEWSRADVAHLHNTLRTWRMRGRGKPFVLHHHGTYYRQNADALNAVVAQEQGRSVVATLDLLDYGDDLTWCPPPFDLEWLASLRTPRRGRLRVGHSPTDRGLKDTEAFLAACESLDVEPLLTEHQPWRYCLEAKGSCDLFYDQVQLGYGHNAIEAWGMGIPVIAGGSQPILRAMRDQFGDLPFYEATRDTIGDAIRALMDEATREQYAAKGLAHVRRWHDGTETIARLTPIYQSLI